MAQVGNEDEAPDHGHRAVRAHAELAELLSLRNASLLLKILEIQQG